MRAIMIWCAADSQERRLFGRLIWHVWVEPAGHCAFVCCVCNPHHDDSDLRRLGSHWNVQLHSTGMFDAFTSGQMFFGCTQVLHTI